MAMMAQPSVRAKAMADKDQSAGLGTKCGSSRLPKRLKSLAPLQRSRLNWREPVPMPESWKMKPSRSKWTLSPSPSKQNYQSLIRQLRDRNAVGVVVAVNGRIIWADVFASTDLLAKYWPKLVRSYASEAVVTRAKEVQVGAAQAQAFLSDMEGRREMIESEPGIYRHTEVTGRRIQGILADIAAAEDRLRRARGKNGRVKESGQWLVVSSE